MAPDPKCAALAAAKARKGAYLFSTPRRRSFTPARGQECRTLRSQAASVPLNSVSLTVSFTELNPLLDLLDGQRVIIDVDFLFSVVTGQSKATDAEFNALGQYLGVSNVRAVEHSTKVPLFMMWPIH